MRAGPGENIGGEGMARCPDIDVTLNGGHCIGDTLMVSSSGRMDRIVWYCEMGA